MWSVCQDKIKHRLWAVHDMLYTCSHGRTYKKGWCGYYILGGTGVLVKPHLFIMNLADERSCFLKDSAGKSKSVTFQKLITEYCTSWMAEKWFCAVQYLQGFFSKCSWLWLTTLLCNKLNVCNDNTFNKLTQNSWAVSELVTVVSCCLLYSRWGAKFTDGATVSGGTYTSIIMGGREVTSSHILVTKVKLIYQLGRFALDFKTLFTGFYCCNSCIQVQIHV